jgi:hypothetical protein
MEIVKNKCPRDKFNADGVLEYRFDQIFFGPPFGGVIKRGKKDRTLS